MTNKVTLTNKEFKKRISLICYKSNKDLFSTMFYFLPRLIKRFNFFVNYHFLYHVNLISVGDTLPATRFLN